MPFSGIAMTQEMKVFVGHSSSDSIAYSQQTILNMLLEPALIPAEFSEDVFIACEQAKCGDTVPNKAYGEDTIGSVNALPKTMLKIMGESYTVTIDANGTSMIEVLVPLYIQNINGNDVVSYVDGIADELKSLTDNGSRPLGLKDVQIVVDDVKGVSLHDIHIPEESCRLVNDSSNSAKPEAIASCDVHMTDCGMADDNFTETGIIVIDGVDGDYKSSVLNQVETADLALHKGSKKGIEHESQGISTDDEIGEVPKDMVGKETIVMVKPIFKVLSGKQKAKPKPDVMSSGGYKVAAPECSHSDGKAQVLYEDFEDEDQMAEPSFAETGMIVIDVVDGDKVTGAGKVAIAEDEALHKNSVMGCEHIAIGMSTDLAIGEFTKDVEGNIAMVLMIPEFEDIEGKAKAMPLADILISLNKKSAAPEKSEVDGNATVCYEDSIDEGQIAEAALFETKILVVDGVDGDKEAIVEGKVITADIAKHIGSALGIEHESWGISTDVEIGEMSKGVDGKETIVLVKPMLQVQDGIQDAIPVPDVSVSGGVKIAAPEKSPADVISTGLYEDLNDQDQMAETLLSSKIIVVITQGSKAAKFEDEAVTADIAYSKGSCFGQSHISMVLTNKKVDGM